MTETEYIAAPSQDASALEAAKRAAKKLYDRPEVMTTRAVLKVTDQLTAADALCSGDFPTSGIHHIEFRSSGELVIRGTLAGVCAAQTFLLKAGAVA